MTLATYKMIIRVLGTVEWVQSTPPAVHNRQAEFSPPALPSLSLKMKSTKASMSNTRMAISTSDRKRMESSMGKESTSSRIGATTRVTGETI
jgi:hypothetical protein